jgi:hypothetical protein
MTPPTMLEALAAAAGEEVTADLVNAELSDIDGLQFAHMVEALARVRAWQASLQRVDGVLERAIAGLLRDFRAGFWPVEVDGVGVVELAPPGDARTVIIKGGRQR